MIKLSLAIAALVATAMPSLAQYSVSGTGGLIPATGSGGGGDAATMLPTFLSTFPLTTPVPANATNITSVVLTSVAHTWSGDCQFVLYEPTMTTGYNLVSRLGCTTPTSVGFNADFGGTYTLVPAGSGSINATWPVVDQATPISSGTYAQSYGIWVSGSAGVNNVDLASIPVVPGTWVLKVYDGASGDTGSIVSWTLNGNTGPTTPTKFCRGDGTGTDCPCFNSGGPGAGCANSASASGASLDFAGTNSVGADTLSLTCSGTPATSTVLFFQGTAQVNGGSGTAFGDGLTCVGGNQARLGTKTAAAGISSYPSGSPSISVQGGAIAGSTLYYQARYRDAANFCMPATFNSTNGVAVPWQP